MGQPVVHVEIIGTDPAKLRSYYAALFGWEFDTGDAATAAVSQPGNYGFVDGSTTGEVSGQRSRRPIAPPCARCAPIRVPR
jgi:predicted enzyme related to lactoylglutathione lyase